MLRRPVKREQRSFVARCLTSLGIPPITKEIAMKNPVNAANKQAQLHGVVARAAVDQAAVVAAQHASHAARTAVVGLKVGATYAVAFVRAFVGK
jgi:hypothetical protein